MKTKLILATLLTIHCVFAGCTRKKGCTDPEAWNYDLDAKVNNETCEYRLDIDFYMSQSGLDNYKLAGVDSVKLIAGGSRVGDFGIDDFELFPPECLGNIEASLSVVYFEPKTHNYEYQVKDMNNNVLLDTFIVAPTGICNQANIDI